MAEIAPHYRRCHLKSALSSVLKEHSPFLWQAIQQIISRILDNPVDSLNIFRNNFMHQQLVGPEHLMSCETMMDEK